MAVEKTVSEAIHYRRSVRVFKNEAIDEEKSLKNLIFRKL